MKPNACAAARSGPQLLLVFALTMLACTDARRGCAKRAQEAASDPLMSEIDCPGGIARCTSGVVDVSMSARRPANCRGEQCSCPRRTIGACGQEKPIPCVRDAVEVAVRDDNDALARLCASVGSTAGVLLRDVPKGAVDVECAHGEVRVNGDAVARCASACGVEGDAFVASDLDARTLLQLMCERRASTHK